MSFPPNLSSEEQNLSPYFPLSQPERDPLLSPGRIALHSLLFIATVFTTCVAGMQWQNRSPFDLSYLAIGLPYAASILSILTAHEFGHYFAAKYHRVSSTLPFYIPVPSFLLNPFGTMGAVIRIRSKIPTHKALFDIGIAGPLAGLVVTVVVLIYGILTLPGKEFLYSIHPEYQKLQSIPTYGLTLGHSVLFWSISHFVAGYKFFPPMNELYHYPFLCAAWFGFFITAMNLIPVGQLDGGHILYSLIGRKQGIIARIFLVALVLVGLSGFLPMLGISQLGSFSTTSWLIWAAILFFLIRADHPPIYDTEPLDNNRRLLGWITFGLFFLIFIPMPFIDVPQL